MGKFGPGLVVTAAFIGPGTITTATVAGANFGFALVWAVLFSVFTAIVLQEMSARLGLVAREGLAEALRNNISSAALRWPVLLIIVVAIGIGNAAYQSGNLTGAAIGASHLVGVSHEILVIATAVFASALLFLGRYKYLEIVLIVLVATMSLVFLLTVILAPPSPAAFFAGLVPSMPDESTLIVIALVGTTVVPYNLFLHASIVREKWGDQTDLQRSLKEARVDTVVSILIGGAITLAILTTSAMAFYGNDIAVTGATLAKQLEPTLGSNSRYLVAAGLMAAGATSVMTAPLAAAYAVRGVFGWRGSETSASFRAIWIAVMLAGIIFALIGTSPVTLILLAQSANALILPIVAIALVWVVNQPGMGLFKNAIVLNVCAAVVICITLGLGGFRIYGMF